MFYNVKCTYMLFSTSFPRKSHNWHISQSYAKSSRIRYSLALQARIPRPGGLSDVNLCVPGSTTPSRTKYGNQQPFSYVWVKYCMTLFPKILIFSRYWYCPDIHISQWAWDGDVYLSIIRILILQPRWPLPVPSGMSWNRIGKKLNNSAQGSNLFPEHLLYMLSEEALEQSTIVPLSPNVCTLVDSI